MQAHIDSLCSEKQSVSPVRSARPENQFSCLPRLLGEHSEDSQKGRVASEEDEEQRFPLLSDCKSSDYEQSGEEYSEHDEEASINLAEETR